MNQQKFWDVDFGMGLGTRTRHDFNLIQGCRAQVLKPSFLIQVTSAPLSSTLAICERKG